MAEYITRYNATIAATNSIWEGKRSMSDVADAINKIPSEDVAPVRHARWEWFEEWIPSTTAHPAECEDCGWRCGNCMHVLEDMVGGYWDNPDEMPQLAYCPNCGAKMDLEDAE